MSVYLYVEDFEVKLAESILTSRGVEVPHNLVKPTTSVNSTVADVYIFGGTGRPFFSSFATNLTTSEMRRLLLPFVVCLKRTQL